MVVAQDYFEDCAFRTESNATIILPDDLEVKIDGHPPKGPLEVAVFTKDNHCVGATQWGGEAASLTAWGAVPSSIPEETALHPGDSMYVRIFDRKCGLEYNRYNSRITLTLRDDAPYTASSAEYSPDGIYVVDQISLRSSLSREEGDCFPVLVPFFPFLKDSSSAHTEADNEIVHSHTGNKQEQL